MRGEIRTTVPALPRGMGRKKGCTDCGAEGKLTAVDRRTGQKAGAHYDWLCPACVRSPLTVEEVKAFADSLYEEPQ